MSSLCLPRQTLPEDNDFEELSCCPLIVPSLFLELSFSFGKRILDVPLYHLVFLSAIVSFVGKAVINVNLDVETVRASCFFAAK